MTTVLLVIHLLLAIALVCIVLLQRSEGGALGMGGGGGMGGFMTSRSTANLLTRTTAVIAACFMFTSLILAVLASHQRTAGSLLDQKPATEQSGTPSQPAAPLAK